VRLGCVLFVLLQLPLNAQGFDFFHFVEESVLQIHGTSSAG